MSRTGRPTTDAESPAPRGDAVDRIVHQWSVQRPNLDVSALQVLGRMHRCFIQYQASVNALFAKYDLNMAAFDVMAALRRSGEPYRMTAGELAKSSLVTTGGITLRIDRLEEAGLVERHRIKDDRRVVYAQLTVQGLQLIDEIAEAHFENEQRLIAGISESGRARLAAMLKSLEASIVAARRLDPSS